MSNTNDNNGLYFLVGGLLVAVVVVGALYFTNTDQREGIVHETNTVVEKTIDKADTNKDDGSSFELNVDEDGFKASTTNNN